VRWVAFHTCFITWRDVTCLCIFGLLHATDMFRRVSHREGTHSQAVLAATRSNVCVLLLREEEKVLHSQHPEPASKCLARCSLARFRVWIARSFCQWLCAPVQKEEGTDCFVNTHLLHAGQTRTTRTRTQGSASLSTYLCKLWQATQALQPLRHVGVLLHALSNHCQLCNLTSKRQVCHRRFLCLCNPTGC